MDAKQLITGRRSIRKYKDEIVSKELLNEIMELTKFAPSWANFQIARYHFVSDQEVIKKIADEGVHGFVYNKSTLANTKNLLVLSFVQGKSGKLDPEKNDFATAKSNAWEMFDAGIACQTFCLAAYEKGIGTCIFGVIDDKSIAKIIDLPENETVACVITFGHPAEEVKPTPRKDVSEIARFI